MQYKKHLELAFILCCWL